MEMVCISTWKVKPVFEVKLLKIEVDIQLNCCKLEFSATTNNNQDLTREQTKSTGTKLKAARMEFRKIANRQLLS